MDGKRDLLFFAALITFIIILCLVPFFSGERIISLIILFVPLTTVYIEFLCLHDHWKECECPGYKKFSSFLAFLVNDPHYYLD